MCTLNLMTSFKIFSISVCSSSRRVLARRVSCSNLGERSACLYFHLARREEGCVLDVGVHLALLH